MLFELQDRTKMGEEWWNCAERGLCVGSTYLKYKSMHKYTRVARAQDGVEVKSIIYLALVKKDMLHFVQCVRAVRGMGLVRHLRLPCCTV